MSLHRAFFLNNEEDFPGPKGETANSNTIGKSPHFIGGQKMEDYILKEIEQILYTAIRKTETAKEQYIRGSEISLTGEIQELFLMLADAENRSLERLKAFLQALEEDQPSEIVTDPSPHG